MTWTEKMMRKMRYERSYCDNNVDDKFININDDFINDDKARGP